MKARAISEVIRAMARRKVEKKFMSLLYEKSIGKDTLNSYYISYYIYFEQLLIILLFILNNSSISMTHIFVYRDNENLILILVIDIIINNVIY